MVYSAAVHQQPESRVALSRSCKEFFYARSEAILNPAQHQEGKRHSKLDVDDV
jgi:hypothetical protein